MAISRSQLLQPMNLVMLIASVGWFALQTWAKPVDPTVNQAFLLVLGAWITNKSVQAKTKDDQVAAKVDAVTDTVTTNTAKIVELQDNAGISKDRADASEEREAQRSLHKEDES